MKYKIFDFILSLIIILLFTPIIIIISTIIYFVDGTPILHFSLRSGLNGRNFLMPKFRTMKLDAPNVATEDLRNPELYISNLGKFLRKTSLDEIPQIFSVLIGHMSIVGPRPALFNQINLIETRKKLGINKIKPGITGLAQINGRDNLTLEEKVNYDLLYLRSRSILLNIIIIFKTIFNFNKGIKH